MTEDCIVPVGVRLPRSLHARVKTAAEAAGQTVNAWMLDQLTAEAYRQEIERNLPARATVAKPPPSFSIPERLRDAVRLAARSAGLKVDDYVRMHFVTAVWEREGERMAEVEVSGPDSARINVYVGSALKREMAAAGLDASAIARHAWREALKARRLARAGMEAEYGPYAEPVKGRAP